jgi:hypothetical protein
MSHRLELLSEVGNDFILAGFVVAWHGPTINRIQDFIN